MESSSSNNRLGVVAKHLTSTKIKNEPIIRNSLDAYRQKSTLENPLALRDLYYGAYYSLRERIFRFMASDPDFKHHTSIEADRKTQRYLSMRCLKKLTKEFGVSLEEYKANPSYISNFTEAIQAYDQGLTTKIGVHWTLYCKTIMFLGTGRHHHFLQRAVSCEEIGCFALTELGHGSNVREIMTTATYDQASGEFILNTPSDLAMKFWIGAAGQLATMSTVFAQLIIGEKNYGVFAFVVQIRNKVDHSPMPGVVIGDCGPKVGCDIIDNGFLIFKNVRIPRENLLDKLATVNNKGEFVPVIKNAEKRFALSLGALSNGRIYVSSSALNNLRNALTIGIRYACIRRQFGNKSGEIPIIEYPVTQFRLFPYLANVYAYHFTISALRDQWDSHQEILFDGKNPLLAELHALFSIVKPLTSWMTQKGIQEVRELCGGLGYSAYNRLGALLNDNNVHATWEGDNNVLMQQSAKFLLENYSRLLGGATLEHKSLACLKTTPWNEERSAPLSGLFEIDTLKRILEFRLNMVLQTSFAKYQDNMGKAPDAFVAWSNTQVFHLRNLSIAYGECFIADEFAKIIKKNNDKSIKNLLRKLFELWALNVIIIDLGTFRENNYLTEEHAKVMKTRFMELCGEIKDEAAGLIDPIAAPDEILGSPIGASDGDAYNRFLTMVTTAPGCYEKPVWWKEFKGYQ